MDSSTIFQPNLRFGQIEGSYSSRDLGGKFEAFLTSQYLERIFLILGDKDQCPGNMSCEHLISGVAKSHSKGI
jgi:hypothetical protein